MVQKFEHRLGKNLVFGVFPRPMSGFVELSEPLARMLIESTLYTVQVHTCHVQRAEPLRSKLLKFLVFPAGAPRVPVPTCTFR